MSAITELAREARWKIRSIIDLGSPAGTCMVCHRPIRYEYTVSEAQGERSITTGSTCGPTLVQASMSEQYWLGLQRQFEAELGRALTPEEIAKKKGEVSKAEWKRMAKAFAEDQEKSTRDQLPKLLERYVHLNPVHNFPKSVHQQLLAGRRLSVRQVEVLTEILSDTDWDELEKVSAQKFAPPERVGDMGRRLETLLAWESHPEAVRAMLTSFQEQFQRKGVLSPKQLAVVERAEKTVLGLNKPMTAEGRKLVQDFTGKPSPAAPAPLVPQPAAALQATAEEKCAALLSGANLTDKQRTLLVSFKGQINRGRTLSEKQAGIVDDIFRRLAPSTASASTTAPRASTPAPSARSRYAEDTIDPSEL